MSEKSILTFTDPGFAVPPLAEYDYQIELTKELDISNQPIDQDWVNQVILWKVNRYAKMDEPILSLLQSVQSAAQPDEKVIGALLSVRGVQLAMASTLLRFCNPNVYQIIDQRVFRVIYGAGKSIHNITQDASGLKRGKGIQKATNQYLAYLGDLRAGCDRLGIKFCDADRLLYMADKRWNGKISLSGYGTKQE